MASHLRRQIREGIASAIGALATTGPRVFQSRVYPLETADLPGILIYTQGETSEATTLGAPRIYQRTARVSVIPVAQATADLDDVLDGICKEVEVALAMPNGSLPMIKSITLTATDIEFAGNASKPTGQAAMTYEVVYMAAENAPDVAY